MAESDVQVLSGCRVSIDGLAVDDAASHRQRPAALEQVLALAAGPRLPRSTCTRDQPRHHPGTVPAPVA